MPELPEVETIKRGLEKRIVGKTIRDVDVRAGKLFIGDHGRVVGKRVESVQRRAKVLCVCLEGDANLLFHLKMTGQLIFRRSVDVGRQTLDQNRSTNDKQQTTNDFAGGHPTQDWVAELPNAFTRITFTFDDGSRLFFNDMRMFGWCKVLSTAEVEKIFQDEYGSEPFSEEFSVEYLESRAGRYPNRKIKQFILDQAIIAGVGNIYADESLFMARISPLRLVKDVSHEEWAKLQKAIIKSLGLGIEWGGASIDTFVNAEGEVGGAHLHTKVYRREGKPCPNDCGGVVEKITVGGRGTHYCPSCQK